MPNLFYRQKKAPITNAQFPDTFSAAASFHAGGLASDTENGPHFLIPEIKAEIYENALHGFTMADLPAYNPRALEKHRQNLTSLLQRSL